MRQRAVRAMARDHCMYRSDGGIGRAAGGGGQCARNRRPLRPRAVRTARARDCTASYERLAQKVLWMCSRAVPAPETWPQPAS